MTIDLTRMRLKVRKPLGIVDATDPDLLDADIDEYLNLAFWEVQDKFPFREKETIDTFPTVIGTRDYTMPASLEALKSLAILNPANSQHQPLDWMLADEYERRYNENTGFRGLPLKYLRESSYVRLWPTPDAVYTVTRRRNVILADLASGNTTLVIPQIWIEIVVYGAIWRAFIDFGDIDRSTAIKAHQIALINTVTSTAEQEAGDPRLTQARSELDIQQQLKTINDQLALKLKVLDRDTQVGARKIDGETTIGVQTADNNIQQRMKELSNDLAIALKTLDIALQPKLKEFDDTQTLTFKKLDKKLQIALKEVDNEMQSQLKSQDNILQFNLGKLDAVLKKGMQEVNNILALDLKTLDVALQPRLRKLDNQQALELKRLDLVLQPQIKQLENRLQHILVSFDNVLQLDLKELDNTFQVSLKTLDNVVKYDVKVLDNIIMRDLRRLDNYLVKGVSDDFFGFWGTTRQLSGLQVYGRDYDMCDPNDDDDDTDELLVN